MFVCPFVCPLLFKKLFIYTDLSQGVESTGLSTSFALLVKWI